MLPATMELYFGVTEMVLISPGVTVTLAVLTTAPDVACTVQVPTRFEGQGPIIAQAGQRGEWIGWLDLTFDAEGSQTAFDGNSEALTAQYGDDSEMKRYVNEIGGE